MSRIRHIALTTQYPDQVAAFYKEAFDLKEVNRNAKGSVFLSDGHVQLAILAWRTPEDGDQKEAPGESNYSGMHHIGIVVDDIEEAHKKLERVRGKRLDVPKHEGRAPDHDTKWAAPDDVLLDVSVKGWVV